MRWTLMLFASILISLSGLYVYQKKEVGNVHLNVQALDSENENKQLTRLKHITSGTKEFLKQNHYNTSYCFLIDMRVASGHKRFYVYDLKNDSVLLKGLVTHGSGTTRADTIQYSNVPGSNCTSLGRYKTGKSYQGKFGLAYKLYGIDKTNNNAFKRFVVLHSHPCVPDKEIAPLRLCSSWGCPTVSPAFLNQLKMYLDSSRQPVLLWIFN